MADGQFAINNNSASAGLFFKDSTGATIIKVGPVHVGTTAPNATPGAGGSSGNSTGEVWLDTSLTPVGVKIWNGSAWVNGTPTGSTTVQGLLELATDVETQAGSDAARAVTPAGLQSKVSDSISTTSSTTIASSTAVKSAYDLANAGLPKSGGTVTGNLEIGTTGSLTFEGSTADGFETTLAVVDPTGDRTITLPNISGTVVTTGDTGTVTSTMLLDGTIVNADVNASAAIAGTKIAPDFGSQTIQTTGIVSHALGTALAPTVTFTGDTNTGLYSPGADQVAISTNGTGRLFVDASGNVGLVSAPSAFGTRTAIQLNGAVNNWFAGGVNGVTLFSRNLYNDGGNKFIGSSYASTYYQNTSGEHVFEYSSASGTAGAAATMFEAMRITNTGRLGLGSSNPLYTFDCRGQGAFELYNTSGGGNVLNFRPSLGDANKYNMSISAYDHSGEGTGPSDGLSINGFDGVSICTGNSTGRSERLRVTQAGALNFTGAGTAGVTQAVSFNGSAPVNSLVIDSSGRLLVGTSTARSNFTNRTDVAPALQVEGLATALGDKAISIVSSSSVTSRGAHLYMSHQLSGTIGGNTVLGNNNQIGLISFNGSDGSEFVEAATIGAFTDGTPGTDDMPGRLVFSTTADGASSPTERMRIKSNGTINFSNVATYADNAAATTGGLAVGDVYRTSTGQLMIRY
jgi:hypothetical protein